MQVNSIFLGIFFTLLVYGFFSIFHNKGKSMWTNPMILSMIVIPLLLHGFHLPYQQYEAGAKYITYFLGPATIALAIPLARQFPIFKKNLGVILIGSIVGSVSSLAGNFLISYWAGLPKELVYSMAPKSVTTPIAIQIALTIDGNPSLSTGLVICTGVFGMIISHRLLNLYGVKDPISRGLAMGTAFHAIGIVRAREESELAGAIGSIAIVLAGIFTTLTAPLIGPLFRHILP
jgi:predicted murein hydrolase (TIGR00659 family)